MAQANAARNVAPGFVSDGLDATTPSATSLQEVPIGAYGTFSLPHQPATPAISPTSPSAFAPQTSGLSSPTTAFPGSLRSTPGGYPRVQAQSSNVMDETMNVIDEHITDMGRPSLSVPRGLDRRVSNDSGSQYSTDFGRRPSFVNGSETDEEEESSTLTRQTVMQWSPAKVAEYLEKVGVEKNHCEVFMEEEFSGEVLLDLDQSTILLQELKLGSIGRRMKTWQKIRTLQEQVKLNQAPPPANTSTSRPAPTAGFTPIQDQLSPTFTTPNFSRVGAPKPAQKGSSMDFMDQITHRLPSPTQAGAGAQSPRPSAASIRSMALTAHSRRQSSIDVTRNLPNHAKQPSFDRNWTMPNKQGLQSARQPSYNNDSRPMSTAHLHSMSSDRAYIENRQSQATFDPAFDPERGYMSGSELDVKRQRNMLRKASPESQHEKKRSETLLRNETSRIVSEPMNGASAPMITKLGEPSDVPRSQRMSDIKEGELNDRKGFRAISDAVTGREKALVQSDGASTQSPTLANPSTGNNTPSILSKPDFEDANKSDMSTPLAGPGAAPTNTRRKSGKKHTSAYIRGLEKKTPQEQMINCDYSGWMKKKSSNLMTTWKSRFFVLKGRRLSYYYSMDDKEEKGLIDISNHRVLPTDNDFLTGLHATLTGAGSSMTTPPTPSMPSPASASTTFSNSTNSSSNTTTTSSPSKRASTFPSANSQVMKGDNQTFIFKLLPPRSGLSKAVNFTKPTVHYFAVPSLAEGRQWMACLMKATIDRDESRAVVTTYQQKTISLEKARARRERPAELREVNEEGAGIGRFDGEMAAEGGTDELGMVTTNESGRRRGVELRDPQDDGRPYGEDADGSARNSSVISSSAGGDAHSVSTGSGSGSGSGLGNGNGIAGSLREPSSLRNSTIMNQDDHTNGQGLGIEGVR